MKPLNEMSNIQIEVTNSCNMECTNCSRFVRKKRPFFMDLEEIKIALDSTEGFKGKIGIMGGEPTLHPKFPEICLAMQEFVPYEKRGLWTNGLYWDLWENIIRDTFPLKNIVYNDHNYEYMGQHQPLLISGREIIRDKQLMWELINKCWVQERWSASISPNGAFFCEIACAIDHLFELGGGWEVKKRWWDKSLSSPEFIEQVRRYCPKCSMPIPFSKRVYDSKKEYISIGNLVNLLKKRVRVDNFHIYTKSYSRQDYEENIKHWSPGRFRNFYQHEPNVRYYGKDCK